MTIERFGERSAIEPMPIERSTWETVGEQPTSESHAALECARSGRTHVSDGSNALIFTSRNLNSGRGLRHVRLTSESAGTVDLTLVFDPNKAGQTHLFVTGRSSGSAGSSGKDTPGSEPNAAVADLPSQDDHQQQTRQLLSKVAARLSPESLRETLRFLSPKLPESRAERYASRGRAEVAGTADPGVSEHSFANQVMELQNVLSTGSAGGVLSHRGEKAAPAQPGGTTIPRHDAGPVDRFDGPRPGDQPGDPGALLDLVDKAGRAIWTTVSDAGKAVGSAIGDAASAVGDAVGDAASAVGDAMKDAARAIADYVENDVRLARVDAPPPPAADSPIANDPTVGKNSGDPQLVVGEPGGYSLSLSYHSQETNPTQYDSITGQPVESKVFGINLNFGSLPVPVAPPPNYATPLFDPPISYAGIGDELPASRDYERDALSQPSRFGDLNLNLGQTSVFGGSDQTTDPGRFGDLNLNLPQTSVFTTPDATTEPGIPETHSPDEASQPPADDRTGGPGSEGASGSQGPSAGPHDQGNGPTETKQPTDPVNDNAGGSGGSGTGGNGGNGTGSSGSTGTGGTTDEHSSDE